MIDKLAVMSRLDRSAPSENRHLAADFLAHAETLPVSDQPGHVKVADALRLWTARLENTHRTNRPIQGADLLLTHLRALDRDADLEQLGFVSGDKAGNLFFDAQTGAFVGLTLVDRPPASLLRD